MKTPPYSLTEAKALCADYQWLTGQMFNKYDVSVIDCVAVAPFDDNSKNRFMIYYLLFGDASQALQTEYKGQLFDVIVMTGSAERNELKHESLHAWLAGSEELSETMAPVMSSSR